MYKSGPMNEHKKTIIWDKWERDHSMGEISRAIDKAPATVFSYLQYHGGIQPYKRVKTCLTLSLLEREEISRGLAADQSIRSIAKTLNRSASTISREVQKNGGQTCPTKRDHLCTELTAHKKFSLATNMDVYFCDPSSPWQRGTNENTNGLLRQCFPKGTCLSGYSQDELNGVAKRLNSRPRKTLDFKTPAHKLETVLQ